MSQCMEDFIKQKAKATINEHPDIINLVQMYNDEFASGSENDS